MEDLYKELENLKDFRDMFLPTSEKYKKLTLEIEEKEKTIEDSMNYAVNELNKQIELSEKKDLQKSRIINKLIKEVFALRKENTDRHEKLKEKNQEISESLTDKAKKLENLYKQEYTERKAKEKYKWLFNERTFDLKCEKSENRSLKKQIVNLKKENRLLRKEICLKNIELNSWE